MLLLQKDKGARPLRDIDDKIDDIHLEIEMVSCLLISFIATKILTSCTQFHSRHSFNL